MISGNNIFTSFNFFNYLLNKKIVLFVMLITVAVSFFTFGGVKEDGNFFVTEKKEKGSFAIYESGKTAPLYISSNDYPGVIRALKDLQADIKNVTNSEPELFTNEIPNSQIIIVAGTLGKNPFIDRLVAEKKINTDAVNSKDETFLIQVVENPAPEIKQALIIAGSDKRGTIYGIYNLSENIGVSPWYWWADVPVKKHSNLFVLPGCHSLGSPAVKYRGIFINDEAPALMGWAYEKFGGLNNKFYKKVFELILRLKGNYLWPAMWNNSFNDDDSLNEKLADEYGVVMGTSHHEPMMRAWKEWTKYGHGEWNYQTNESVLREFWRNGIKRMNGCESIVTLGMRGNGDEEMSENANIELLEKIINDQRQIIGDVTRKDVTSIPQVWSLYKEVQDYYDKGLKAPDDVTLLFCDDNWGNIRKLPKLDAKQRKGGYGIYYHADYVGGPRNYKWLNTNQIERIWEQMHLAYEYKVNQIWILNVGDIKPMEFPISFFLDYAWNPQKWTAQKLPDYYKQWAENQFGVEYASDIADIISAYTKYNARIKPELISPKTYSLTNYNEAETVVSDYNKIAGKAKKIYDALPVHYQDAFFQLVLYPVLACANLNELYVSAAKNSRYAGEGRAATDSLAEKVKELFNADAVISNLYNKLVAGGKWNHMMDQTHIGYTYWQQPDSNMMPEVKSSNLPDESGLGVTVEGSENWFPKDTLSLTLPEADVYSRQSYYIEVFNRGKAELEYSAKADESWIKINPSSGKIKMQERLWVSVEWDKAPAGTHKIPITIASGSKQHVVVNAVINNPLLPKRDEADGFIESGGYVSVEAEHYTKAVGSSSIKWIKIPNLGRTLSAVTAFPVTAPSQNAGDNSPHLEYKLYLFSAGKIKVESFFSPTLKFGGKDLHYGISFDDEKPQIINMTPNPNYADLNKDGLWNKWVADNINIEESKHNILKPGWHVLKFWLIDPGVVLQKIVIDAGGLKPSYLGPAESFYNMKSKK